MARLHRPARLLGAIANRPSQSELSLASPCSLASLPFSPRYISWWNPFSSSAPPRISLPQAADTSVPQIPSAHGLHNPSNDDEIMGDDDPSAAWNDSTPADSFANSAQSIGDEFPDGYTETVNTDWMSPADLMVAFLDCLHDTTGFPWWATISFSAIMMRALLVPLSITQLKKMAKFQSLGPKLQIEKLVHGWRQGNFREEYQLFRKRRLELGCPSPAWIVGPGLLVQAPLFLLVMYSVRRMALEQHSDFIVGGALWFKDLTVSGHGVIGAVLPLVVAVAYLTNVQVLFQGVPARQGLYATLEKVWKRWLQFSTVLIFFTLCYFPQASLMFSVPHSIMTLCQNVLLRQQKFVSFLIGSQAGSILRHPAQSNRLGMVDLSSYDKLLQDAGVYFSSGKSRHAICLLEYAIKEEPEKEEAYALLGWVYKQNEDWEKSYVYYKHAISKGKGDEFKIAAYEGSGLALLKQGKTMECIEILREIKDFKLPANSSAQYSYYSSMFILSRALLMAGLMDESKEVMKEAKEYALNNNL